MIAAYLDTSCLVAIAFGERGASRTARALASYDVLLSSNLLEAEFRAALQREGLPDKGEDFLSSIAWILPDRPLTDEIAIVLAAGQVRGADLWHLAAALFADPRREIHFLTLDARQEEVSRALGFRGLR